MKNPGSIESRGFYVCQTSVGYSMKPVLVVCGQLHCRFLGVKAYIRSMIPAWLTVDEIVPVCVRQVRVVFEVDGAHGWNFRDERSALRSNICRRDAMLSLCLLAN